MIHNLNKLCRQMLYKYFIQRVLPWEGLLVGNSAISESVVALSMMGWHTQLHSPIQTSR